MRRILAFHVKSFLISHVKIKNTNLSENEGFAFFYE